MTGKKVFISYSHKDEEHRNDLEDHLTMLRRNGTISVWHDRKIIPGDDWKNEIDKNIELAEIIIFLVSPSFLASDYCYDIEVKRALEKHEEGSATIIAIIVRPCAWSTCEFSRLQAVPKDAVAITLWNNRDSAWLDAVNGLTTHIEEFKKKETALAIPKTSSETVEVSEQQLNWLEDTEILLTHRKLDKVRLSDVYVIPDIEFEDEHKPRKERDIVESDVLFNSKGRYLVFGEDQQGKTSLLKKAFYELALSGAMPIYIDAASITKNDIQKILQKEITKQYCGLTLETFNSNEKKVLLIDNLDEIGLNSRHRDIFLEGIAKEFDWIIATCHSAFSYISSEIPALAIYKSSNLLGFGNLKREEIIRKWISLGVEESIDDGELYSQCDELKNQLNIVIKRNIVPPKPIYVLMMMQMFEAYSQQNIELTSYGHCYQQLIYQSFEKAKIHGKEYEKYLNVLTEIAWEIFLNGRSLTNQEVDRFFENYGKQYLSVSKIEILNKLISNSILAEKNFKVTFKYPYIYYFFVGKKFAEGFSESSEVKSKIDDLLKNLHREDYANILIFITHHTKDSWVLNKIKEVLSSLFEENEKATLTKEQLSFMNDFMKKIPELVIEQREIQKERDDKNRKLDEYERRNIDDEQDQSVDILAKINKAFKGMEIAGQIIRNRHATMTRGSIYDLAGNGVSTGLRFLDYFIKISDSSKTEIVKFISQTLSEHPNISDREIQEHAESAYLHLTYGVVNAVTRKIASAIGSKEAYEVYNFLENNENTPAYTLINQAIELQFKRIIDIDTLQKTTEKLKNNPVCLRILKEMVVQHIYMFPVEYKEKQQLSKLLGISVQGQRQMDLRKLGKG